MYLIRSSRLLWGYLPFPVNLQVVTRCSAFPTYCNRSGSSERMQTTKNVSSKRTNYQPTRSRIARLQGPDTTRQRRRWKRGRDWLARGVIWHARLHRPIRADLSQRLITPAPFVTFLFPARFAQLFVSGGRPLPPGQIPDTPSDDPRPRRVAQIASLMAITSCCSAIYCSSDHAPVDGGRVNFEKVMWSARCWPSWEFADSLLFCRAFRFVIYFTTTIIYHRDVFEISFTLF